MSLHVELSPEAQERLREQKRNTTITSIIIALLSVTLLFTLLGLYLLSPPRDSRPPLIKWVDYVEVIKPPEPPIVRKTPDTKRPPSAAPRPVKVITSPRAPAIPNALTPPIQPSEIFGSADVPFIGTSNNDIFNPSQFPPSGPIVDVIYNGRCSAGDRMKRLKQSGGTVEGEAAVIKALDYFKATQNPDGSWSNQYQVAMTGFALLAYLGHCETPQSRNYGTTVSKAINYLIDNGLKNKGRLAVTAADSNQWVYEHAIATYALAEAYTLSMGFKNEIPQLKQVVKEAGDLIIEGQAPSGGWNYRYGQANTGDNSVGFWQMQALKACMHTKIWPESKFKRTIRNAHEFLTKVQGQDGAIGYREDSKRSPGLTGGGLLCYQIWGEGDSKPAKRAMEYLVRNNTSFDPRTSNLYYHYYNAQAFINAGGKEWEQYNLLFRDSLIKAQNPDGSWTQKVGSHGPVNDHMATALATLMLEVYYRFLPSSELN